VAGGEVLERKRMVMTMPEFLVALALGGSLSTVACV